MSSKTHQGHTARKRFGQNFLVDQSIINSIVAAITPQKGERIVEIGPGLAALTNPLIQAQGKIDVVEIDRDIVARLKKRCTPEQIHIHEGDALAFDFGQLAQESGQKLRIVGNLPYNISSPLLFHLADFAEQVQDQHFMLQKEVVERMVAEPGSADFSRLSVMLQYRYHMVMLFVVPPESFEPAPKVDSAIVRMVPRPVEQLQAQDPALFAQVVSAAFSQRRKMIRNTLKGLATEEQLLALNIPPTARAEDIPVADYVRLANLLGKGKAES